MMLSQKETTLLQDMISDEKLCIDKYNKYSSQAHDAQLKNLFTQLGQIEQQHLNTLNQISSGAVPAMNASGGGQQTQSATSATYTAGQNNDPNKQDDKFLCQDALSTEKHVSSVYNTGIFEFKDVGVRNALNHIQKEEQEHGEKIYSYMEQNSMYS